MSKIQNFIKKDIEKNPKLKKKYEQASLNLDAAVLVKPQSTIGRIEAGNMNVSIGLLNEIANRAHRQVKLVLI